MDLSNVRTSLLRYLRTSAEVHNALYAMNSRLRSVHDYGAEGEWSNTC